MIVINANDLNKIAEALADLQSAAETYRVLLPHDHSLLADISDVTGSCEQALGHTVEAGEAYSKLGPSVWSEPTLLNSTSLTLDALQATAPRPMARLLSFKASDLLFSKHARLLEYAAIPVNTSSLFLGKHSCLAEHSTVTAVRLGAARTIVELGIHQHDTEIILQKLEDLEAAHQRGRR
jgi:hypothetical protein